MAEASRVLREESVVPRLSTKQYLQTHHRLRKLWLQDHSLFAELAPVEQWILHDFFKPDLDLTDDQLIAHRKQVTAERPGLPHHAGKILRLFWENTAALSLRRVRTAKAPAAKRRGSSRHVVVKSIVRREPDAQQFARALIMLAEHINEQQENQDNQDKRSRP